MLWFGLLFLLCLSPPSQGERAIGHLHPSDFHYLTKFAFDFDSAGDVVGVAKFTLEIDPADSPLLDKLELLAYSDEDHSWPEVWDNDGLSCDEKSLRAHLVSPGNIRFSPEGVAEVQVELIQKLRPRFWFFAVARCDSKHKQLAEVQWDIRMQNVQSSDWSMELGVNIMGFNTMYVVFFTLHSVFGIFHLLNLWTYKKMSDFIHPLVRIYSFILGCLILSTLFHMMNWVIFTNDGMGSPFLMQLGAVFDIITKSSLVFLILLIAKGWTISHDTIKRMSRVWILGIIALFTAFELGVSFYAFSVRDRPVVKVPSTLRGLFVVQSMIWIVLGCYFAAILRKSWSRERNPERRSLYISLGVVFVLWFVLMPVAWILEGAVSPWVRDKWVQGMRLATTTFVVYLQGFMLRPSAADRWFKVGNPSAPGIQAAYRELDSGL